MFNPLQAAKDLGRQRNQNMTTVIRVKEYKFDKQNPKMSTIIAEDLFNKDENGLPKTVEVRHVNEKAQGVNEFGDRRAMMHTGVGGTIRLSRYKVDGNGTYLAEHMQRISETDGPKIDGKQVAWDINFLKAWVKAYPLRDKNDPSQLAMFNLSGRLFHKANVMVVPEDAKVSTIEFGSLEQGEDTFETQFRSALSKAIDDAPGGALPMLVCRIKGWLDAREITVGNYKLDANKNRIALTKEEMIDGVIANSKVYQELLLSHKQAVAQETVVPCEAVAGFRLGAIGMKWDGKSKVKNDQGDEEPNFIDRSTVENVISETAQRHKLPQTPGSTKTLWAVDEEAAPQYAFGVVSYRRKQVEPGEVSQCDMETFGRDSGAQLQVSPNAGLDEKPNPYLAQQPQNQASQTTQTNQAQEPANPPAASNQQAPAAQTSQTAAPEHQAAAPANQSAQTTQTNQVAQPNQGSPKIEETEDELPPQEDFGLEDFDIDMDELEGQLAHHQL